MKWLGGLVEAEGIDIFTGFSGAGVLYDGDAGGRRAHGRSRHRTSTARRSPTFEPGVDIRAKVTILSDGVRGNLTKAARPAPAARRRPRSPQVYAIGIKELWEVPPTASQPGTVIHTMGYPLRIEEFGGGFIYAMPDGRRLGRLRRRARLRIRCSIRTSAFQHFKQHPLVCERCSQGGQMVRYGAKALPEGGWHTIPRVYTDGG